MNLQRSVVLVTGATGGLGQRVRHAVPRPRRGQGLRRRPARPRLGRPPRRPAPARRDRPGAIAAAAAAAQDITVLVNNAGVNGAPSLLTSPEEEIRATYEANVFAPLLLVRAFAPVLARNGGGAVVDVHSVLSWLTRPGAYAASKTAFWGLTNALRLELADQKTQVVGAHLGYTDTPMIAHLDVPKSDPAVIVARILDALEAGRGRGHRGRHLGSGQVDPGRPHHRRPAGVTDGCELVRIRESEARLRLRCPNARRRPARFRYGPGGAYPAPSRPARRGRGDLVGGLRCRRCPGVPGSRSVNVTTTCCSSRR